MNPSDLLTPDVTKFSSIALLILTAVIPAIAAYLVARYQYKSEKKNSKDAIVRKYAHPLLSSTRELEDRLSKLLGNLETDWLDSSYINEIKNGEGFAKNPTKKGYFFISTIYLLARYFSYLEIISQEVGHLFDLPTQQAKQFEKITNTISRIFQYREMWDHCETINKIFSSDDNGVRDAWRLHRQFQHSIGELLICREGDRTRSMSFKQFYENYVADKNFQYWCGAIEDYVVDLSSMSDGDYVVKATKQSDIRIFRIMALRYWLRRLIRTLEEDMDISISSEPYSALDGIPLDIQNVIASCSPSHKDAFFN